jgi:hypothetical protein
MQGQMIRCVVQANVSNIVIARLSAVFECSRLKYWQCDRSSDSRVWFAGMHQFGLDASELAHTQSPARLEKQSLKLEHLFAANWHL